MLIAPSAKPCRVPPGSPTQRLSVYSALEVYFWQQEQILGAIGISFLELCLWTRDPRWALLSQLILSQALVASCCCTRLSVARSYELQSIPIPLDPHHEKYSHLGFTGLGSIGLHLILVVILLWRGSPPLSLAEEEPAWVEFTFLETPSEPMEIEPDASEAEPEDSLPSPQLTVPSLIATDPVADDPEPPVDPAVRENQGVAPNLNVEDIPLPVESLQADPEPTPTPTPVPTTEIPSPAPIATPTQAPIPPPSSSPTPEAADEDSLLAVENLQADPEPTPNPTPVSTPEVPSPAPTVISTQALSTQAPISPSPASPAPQFTPLIAGIPRSAPSSLPIPSQTSPPLPRPSSSVTPMAIPIEPDVLAQPLLGQNPAPAYPRQARQLNQQGTVWLRAKVNQQGQVEEVEIQDSSGFPALDLAAQQAVQEWHFSTAKLNNQPIDSWVILPISFSLN